MKDNPLYVELDGLLSRQAFLQGITFHYKTYFEKYALKGIYKPPNPKFDFLLGTNLIISDVSGETDNGWIKQYSTGNFYGVHYYSKEKTEKELLNNYFGFIIAQSYESLESFLKKILIKYFKIKPEEFSNHFKKNAKQIEESINNLRTKNNREFIKLLCALSEDLHSFLKSNNRNINYIEWFEVFSNVRHAITHKSMRFENSDFSKVTKTNSNRIKELFPSTVYNKIRYYSFNYDLTDWLIKCSCEFGFTIFKFLSIKSGNNWKVLLGMK
jgi:hypothetical protein